jgi:hypothetical protein
VSPSASWCRRGERRQFVNPLLEPLHKLAQALYFEVTFPEVLGEAVALDGVAEALLHGGDQ